MIFIIYEHTYFGTIENINGNIVTISKETWAPGLWCGSEGHVFKFGFETYDSKSKCLKINLNERKVMFDDCSLLCIGDMVFF